MHIIKNQNYKLKGKKYYTIGTVQNFNRRIFHANLHVYYIAKAQSDK